MPRWNRIIGVLGLLVLAGVLLTFLYFAWEGVFEPLFVSAVGTSALVLVTGTSVFLTLLLLEENRTARKREVKPSFSIQLEPVAISTFGVVIENIGNGPAKDVEATLTLYPNEDQWDFRRKNIRPGDQAGASPDDITFSKDSGGKYDRISIEGKCTDVFGNTIPFSDSFDMELLQNGKYGGYNPHEHEDELEEIQKVLNKIRRSIDSVSNEIQLDGLDELIQRRNSQAILSTLRKNGGTLTISEISSLTGLPRMDLIQTLMWLDASNSIEFESDLSLSDGEDVDKITEEDYADEEVRLVESVSK